MGGIGGPELFMILVVVLLVFGPKKIPEVARGLGKGLREFRKLSTDFQREINLSAALEEEEKRETPRSGPPGSVSGTGRPPGPPVSGSKVSSAAPAATVDADEPGSPEGAAPSEEAAPPPADAPTESSDSRKDTDGS